MSEIDLELHHDGNEVIDIPEFPESIRLIVWDLDETFWNGTLTEGGINYVDDHHDLIIDLASRGILSTICSKNTHAVIEALLRERGLWDYFIFPSIDWTPKAQRLKKQIDVIGLRPPTVLFIDDNWQNLNQAADFIPGINIAEPAIIRHLLAHPQLKGKPDPDLERLKQYKNNEAKHQDAATSGGDNIAFLRSSDICVYFEYDIENHIDRVIELINRTNQLNFTKLRLSEDVEAARAELIPFLRHSGTTAGLIRVVDRYGDYGFVGFFAMTQMARTYTLHHFCFSCRTINMYIEHFVYNFLGRPNLSFVGDVLSDVKSCDTLHIDWIRALPISQMEEKTSTHSMRLKSMFVRGGCDLMTLAHYFSLNCDQIDGEFNTIKNWQPLRLDHSSFLMAAIGGLSAEQMVAASKLGYEPEDFESRFPTQERAYDVVLLSFWADADICFYKHRTTGLELPYWMIGTGKENYLVDDAVVDKFSNEVMRGIVTGPLRQEWDYRRGLSISEMIDRYSAILDKIPRSTCVVMTLANARDHRHFHDPSLPLDEGKTGYNEAVLQAVAGRENVTVVDFASYVESGDDILDMNHLRRDLYFRIYEEMIEKIQSMRQAMMRPSDL